MYVSRFASPLSLLASGAVLLASSLARAQDCNADSDCAHGFTCQVVGGSGCAAPACAPNAECPPPPPCDPQVIKACEPSTTCNAHSDCADGWVCYAQTTTECNTVATPTCPPGAPCTRSLPPPPPPECTDVTTRMCVPRYVLPCNTGSDCGAGFNCVQNPESCACAGSGGAPTPAPNGSGSSGTAGGANSGAPTPPGTATPPGPLPPPPPPDCTCTPSTQKHCEPQDVTCNTDSDCPATWTCLATSAPSSGGCTSAAKVLPDGGIEVLPTVCDPPPPPPPTSKQCVPPSYNYPGGVALGSKDESSSATGSAGTSGSGTGIGGPAPIPPTAGSPPPQGTPSPNNGAGAASGSSHGVSQGTNGSAAPASGNSSCQISIGHGAAGSVPVFALLGLAGLAGVARRRRTRWG